MKKIIALVLACALVFSLPIVAVGKMSPNAGNVSGSKQTPKAPAPTPTPVVEASPIPAAVVAAAAAEGKSVGEYVNNMISSLPGLTNVVPLGQGGHVIINGVPSNQTFSVLKPTVANVNSAKSFAASLGGKVLNVAQINASVRNFNTATVNFYLKGTIAGQNIKVYQLVDGQWVELTVTEIREDHVVVNMTSLGVLAFIEEPVQ